MLTEFPLASRFVWNSSFLDAEAASQIGKQIRILILEQTLRETHPELQDHQTTTKPQVQSLHDKYESLTGERFDVNDQKESALSELEKIEIEMRLWKDQIALLESRLPNDDIPERISSIQA